MVLHKRVRWFIGTTLMYIRNNRIVSIITVTSSFTFESEDETMIIDAPNKLVLECEIHFYKRQCEIHFYKRQCDD